MATESSTWTAGRIRELEFDNEKLREALARAELETELRDGVLSMTVARLGGIVEGNPTGRHNFLQRIDELRVKEAECDRLGKAVSDEEWEKHSVEVTIATGKRFVKTTMMPITYIDALLAARRTQERGNDGE